MRWWRTITFENRASPDEWPMLPEVNWWLACSFIVNHIHNGLPHLIHAIAVLGNFMIDCSMAVYHYILCIRWYEGARWQNVINPNKFVKPFFFHDIEHSVRCTTDSLETNELIIVIPFFSFRLFNHTRYSSSQPYLWYMKWQHKASQQHEFILYSHSSIAEVAIISMLILCVV